MTLILFRVDATSNVHQLDFNKRILILEMHGTNIKKSKINLLTPFTAFTKIQQYRNKPRIMAFFCSYYACIAPMWK